MVRGSLKDGAAPPKAPGPNLTSIIDIIKETTEIKLYNITERRGKSKRCLTRSLANPSKDFPS